MDIDSFAKYMNLVVLKKGEVSVGALIHTSKLSQGWWGVYESQVQKMMKAKGEDWGVVFLLGKSKDSAGYWVTSENLIQAESTLSHSKKHSHIHLGDLEGEGNRLSAKKFSTVQDFLRLSGLHPPETTELVNMQRDIKD